MKATTLVDYLAEGVRSLVAATPWRCGRSSSQRAGGRTEIGEEEVVFTRNAQART